VEVKNLDIWEEFRPKTCRVGDCEYAVTIIQFWIKKAEILDEDLEGEINCV
jgi:hypothetical protein